MIFENFENFGHFKVSWGSGEKFSLRYAEL